MFSFLVASIDINTASLEEFVELKGVGEKKARLIVDYRTKIGCFTNIEELIKIKGIGQKTISNNENTLKLGKCK